MAGLKRNLHEMYNSSSANNSLSSSTNNIIDLNDTQQSTMINNDFNTKKIKIENRINTEPSRVVHLRNIASQLTENEIIYLGLYFGNIVNVLFLRSKNQTFLEFELINDAQSMINYFNTTNTQITFHGKKIFVQYSNHQSLQTDPNNSNNQIAQLALDSAKQLYQCAKKGNANTVLRATILNMLYPVTIDVINQIFSKFGNVLKIITFNKNDKFQVLIQMKDSNSAQQAKLSLNGQNIYNGCCTLQIDFSKLTCLEARFNNDKSRDYTNLLLPTGTDIQGLANEYTSNGHHQVQHHQQQGIIGISPSQSNQLLTSQVQQPTSQYTHPNSIQQTTNTQQVQQLHHHHHQQQQQQHHTQVQIQTPVLLISNLNEEIVTPDALFTLFGVYGDVQRVKILFNKKDSALIQFSNIQQAQTSMHNLDRVKLWNKQIRVFPSKHLNVQMPKEGQPDAGLTKDFSNSPLHRFKKPGSKNFNNIYPPSQTLHLSNLPNSIQENELRQVFSPYGNIRAFKFFQKDRKMALIQMDNAEEAVHALIGTHNYQLADNMHLRVTFSKATI